MCGICGVLDFSGRITEDATIGRMVRAIKHRGPDDDGIYRSGAATLGHTRLSILDLTSAGHQPMVSEEGRFALTFNGEIYNFRELRESLKGEGLVFRTGTDTEVLLKAFAKWGIDALPRLNGMFAFALWDAQERTLFLARDRFGVKPLYYRTHPSGLVFGSEIKAILVQGAGERRIDHQALHEYLWYGNSIGERTLFEGIRKLPPGHYLKATDGGMALKPYWDIMDIAETAPGQEEAIRGVAEHLDRAVKRHLVSDVPVGVFLSGGIDSSAITAFASRHYGGKLKTFSVGFDFDKGVNELAKARRVADYFGTDHHELHIAGKNLRDIVETLVRCHDEPFGDSANIPLFLLCRSLTGGTKVVLQGDGGDEIFAGYRRYNLLSRPRFMQSAARVAHAASNLIPRGPFYYKSRRLFAALGNPDSALQMALLLTEETQACPPTSILSRSLREQVAAHDPFAEYRACHERFKSRDPVQRMLYTDCSILLPQTFLEKVDKSTMAHGMEIRVPFLDHELTSYVIGLPSDLKVHKGEKKWILRAALRGIVPDEILDGPKTGFGVPYSHWLRTSLSGFMRSVLSDTQTRGYGLFDHAELERKMEEHVSGSRNNGYLLWKALNLALWYREYIAPPQQA